MRQPLFAQRRFDGRTFGALLAVAAVVAVAVAVALAGAPRAVADVSDAAGKAETVLEVADHSASDQPANSQVNAEEDAVLQSGADESAAELPASEREDVGASDLALAHEEAYGDQPMLVSDGDDASQPGIFEAQLGEEDYGVGIDADEDVPVELMSQQ